MSNYYLNTVVTAPVPMGDGLDQPFWEGLMQEKLLLQRCNQCRRWQWGPEWICHRCLSFDVGYQEVAPTGRLFSHERIWHPVHPGLNDQGPYVVALVEFPQADNVRIVGNLLGDPRQKLEIGAPVKGVFEHHRDSDPAFTLLQWRIG